MVPSSWEEEFLHRPRFAHAHGPPLGAEGRDGNSLLPFGCLLSMFFFFPLQNGNRIFFLIIKVIHVYCEKLGRTGVRRPKVTQKKKKKSLLTLRYIFSDFRTKPVTRDSYRIHCFVFPFSLLTHLVSPAHSKWLCIITLYQYKQCRVFDQSLIMGHLGYFCFFLKNVLF